jgi:hypothetical protein
VAGITQGFLRQPNGDFQTFTADNSATSNGVDINESGVVVGMYLNASGKPQGFVVTDGSVTTFQAPGATQTVPVGINSSGAVAGYYVDNAGVNHGFTRDSLGNFTTIDIPNMTGLYMTGINDSGEVTGYGFINSRNKGFVRNSAGTVQIFYVGGSGTMAMAINSFGETTGGYFYGEDDVDNKGFTRDSSGTFTVFKGAGPFGGGPIFSRSINDSGEVVGAATVGEVNYAFQRTSGKPVIFQDPSASVTPLQGTVATKINSLGRIVGYYYDSTGQIHGFVRNALPPAN